MGASKPTQELDMNKQDLITRYGVARLKRYTKTLGDEHRAKVAAKFAIEDMENTFKHDVKQCGEKMALEILAMSVEDIEKAAQGE